MKKIYTILFILIIGLPLIFGGISLISDRAMDVTLNGYFDEVKMPEISLEGMAQGTFQQEFTEWFGNNFSLRGVLIKTYNTFRYKMFSLGNRIIGKEGDIYELPYIYSELCIGDDYDYSLENNQLALKDYVDKLEQVQSQLNEVGKYLYVYITPNKASVNYDTIPYRYKCQNDESSIRGVDFLRQLLSETSIPYYDSMSIYEELEYPAFYTTGIHWSRTYEQRVSRDLIEELSILTGKSYRNFTIGEIDVSETPYWRDSDVYDLLNIWGDTCSEDYYYQYETERDVPEQYEQLKILVQGGSFAIGLCEDVWQHYSDEEVYRIDYNNYVVDQNSSYLQINQDWNNLDLTYYLDWVDCVVIEINEAVIRNCSNGFVDYLNSVLETYTPSTIEVETTSVEKMDLRAEGYLDVNALSGFWEREGERIWATENCSVLLQDDVIQNQGIDITLSIPEQVFMNAQHDTVCVYVNNVKMYENIFDAGWHGNIHISNETLADVLNEKNIYKVEILCTESFVPKEIGEGEDTRELALQIEYIGVAE